MENRKIEIPIPHDEIRRVYNEFRELIKTYKSFNQFYGKVMRMDDNLELVESLDFYEDNNIMIKVLYKQFYLFEVGMLLPSERITDNWGYIDSMWVFCEDGSKFGEYYEINLHDLVLYNEVKLK